MESIKGIRQLKLRIVKLLNSVQNLNTSFNENEPIVNRPEEALACYLRTNMDMLVMENILVSRKKELLV